MIPKEPGGEAMDLGWVLSEGHAEEKARNLASV